jgi:hypothetical protein
MGTKFWLLMFAMIIFGLLAIQDLMNANTGPNADLQAAIQQQYNPVVPKGCDLVISLDGHGGDHKWVDCTNTK